MTFKPGDRVTFCGLQHGTVVKHIAAQGSFVAVYVVDWENGERTTVWASDLEEESDETGQSEVH